MPKVKQPFKEQAQVPLKTRQKPLNSYWRERIGVEPTVDTAGCLPTDLKSAESTGAHPLPSIKTVTLFSNSAIHFLDDYILLTIKVLMR